MGGDDGSDNGHGHRHGHGDFRNKVWSMSGGPYCRPKHGKRNTGIAMVGVVLICIPIAMESAELEEFNPEPVIPIYNAKPEQVEKALKRVYYVSGSKTKGKDVVEYAECEAVVKIFPPFIEVMKKRGIEDMDLVMVDPWQELLQAREKHKEEQVMALKHSK